MLINRISAVVSGFLLLMIVFSVALAQTTSTAFLPLIFSDGEDSTSSNITSTPSDAATQGGSTVFLPFISGSNESGLVESSAAPAVYFVDGRNGKNTNDGTQSVKAWQTIQYAADNAMPGSIINVLSSASYCEAVTINSRLSGSASAMTTIQNYSASVPILDGSCLRTGSNKFGFMINGANYIVIKGFIIQNYITTVSTEEPVGIIITGNAHHIYIRNNQISKIENRGNDSSTINAYGIKVKTEGNQLISSIFIDGNELSRLVLGNSESLSINGNIDNFWVTNNLVHDSNNIGIDAIGFEDKANPSARAHNGYIINNHVYNIDATSNPAYSDPSAAGIYVDGGDNITIERNRVHDNNVGIEVASEHKGRNATNVRVRSNFIYNNMIAGIGIGGGSKRSGGTSNCQIVNNTLFNNNRKPIMSPGGEPYLNGELWVQYNTTGNNISNNLIYAGQANVLLASPYPSSNTINFNFYYTTGNPTQRIWSWKGNEYTDFVAYKTASHNDANSWLDNPKVDLNSALQSFLHLQVSSPAINKGQALSTSLVGDKDIDGQPRLKNQIDVGADEVQ